MLEELIIETVAPKEQPVQIGGQKYLLVEADGLVSADHRNLMMDNAVWKNGQIECIRGIATAELQLLCKVLYKIGTDEKGEPTRELVPRDVIGRWPSKVVSKLYDAAKKLSGLDETPKNQKSSS